MSTAVPASIPAHRRPFRLLAVVCLTGLLAGCGALPRSGPLASQIDRDEPAGEEEGFVVQLTGPVAMEVARSVDRGFPPEFLAATEIDPRRIGVDDRIDVLVWEPGGAALFGSQGGAGTLPGVRVETDGTVFLPFAGRVQAAGSTPAELRERIRRALEPFTGSPQVDLRLLDGSSRTLTIQGAVPKPGPYPIERINARLVPMLALAGGATLEPERVEVAVRRDGVTGAAMLEDIYRDPALNIALRPDDQVVLTPIRERFIVLGASSIQAELAFPTRELSLLSALGAAGGLRDFDADPSGVFVFRREDAALAAALLEGPEPAGLPPGPGRPVVYQLDMTQPGALFIADAFQMRDGDAIFATNAPFTEVRKFFSVFNTLLLPVTTTSTLAQ